MASVNREEDINSLIYMRPYKKDPTRYEMVRFSTWRVYFFQQLQAMQPQKISQLKSGSAWIEKYPNLIANNQQRQFYTYFLGDRKEEILKQDLISHFVCRMLYCYDSVNHSKFIEMERQLLSIRLHRRCAKDENSKIRHMSLLKNILSYYLNVEAKSFDVSSQDWNSFGNKIVHKDPTSKNAQKAQMFAMIPMQWGEAGIKKRLSFVKNGNVYMNIDCTTDLVLNLFCSNLKLKLQKMRLGVVDLLDNDVENQMSGFIRKTLDTLNTTNYDESLITNQFKLTIKNIQGLWKRFFPPCMLNLTTKLKQNNHLKHEGRRQLWLFLKGCGMDVHDNKQFFYRSFVSKVSASDLKSHMYNIQHAYGLVGKRQAERPKNCRNIITAPAPKKEEHHGCPFHHWRSEDLKQYLRKHYNISEDNLNQVMRQKEENHFQVACGRLFEGVAKAEGTSVIPSEITNMLGRSPHQFFQAGMDLVNHNNNKGMEKKEKITLQGQSKALEF